MVAKTGYPLNRLRTLPAERKQLLATERKWTTEQKKWTKKREKPVLSGTRMVLLMGLLAVIPNTFLKAQTCSCAGTPLISSQSSGASTKGNLLLGITYEYHDISALYSNSRSMVNNEAIRSTQSALLEMHYGITDRLSVSGTATHVEKHRTTGLQHPGGTRTLTTQGVGDGLILLKYVLMQQTLWNPVHVVIGSGAKAPIGTTSLEENGIALNADMQPGTGAWDGVFWSEVLLSLLPYTAAKLLWHHSYRHTGTNERFAADDRYRFGNELVSKLGVSNQIGERLSYMILLGYRSTSSDQLNGNNLPNTGGKWLNVESMLNVGVTDWVSARISGRIPVYQYLNGTQPTTSWAVSGSVFFNFNSSEQEFIHGKND